MDEYSWAEILYCLFLNFPVFCRRRSHFYKQKKSNLIQKVEIFGGGNFDERFQLTITLKRIFGDVQRSQ